ncbi:MAG: VCBS repeat-containing protein [Planctomycetes bacterium]|nr:VCBS repeat-containing protein [Planctomycetota bacterium]
MLSLLSIAMLAAPQALPGTITDIGEPMKFEVRVLAVDTNEGCDVGDIDRDGALDVVAGRLWFHGPDWTPRPLRAIGEFGADFTASNGEFLHDVDGDGWLDVLSIAFLEPELCWYRNPGKQGLARGKLWQRAVLADTGQRTNEAAWLRDMDGDGAPDFVVNSWSQGRPMCYWRLGTDDDGRPTATRTTVGAKGNGHGQGFGDVDGDGREDIVFGRGYYSRPEAQGPWPLHDDFVLPHASCPIVVVDLDGDGRNDLIWGSGHDYGVFFERQLDSADGRTRWRREVIDDTWSQAHTLLWTDLDGDGAPELITGKRVRGHSGSDPGAAEPPSIYCYRWHRERGRFTRHLIAKDVGTGLQLRAADLDGDGRIDLVMAGKDGTQLLLQR